MRPRVQIPGPRPISEYDPGVTAHAAMAMDHGWITISRGGARTSRLHWRIWERDWVATSSERLVGRSGIRATGVGFTKSVEFEPGPHRRQMSGAECRPVTTWRRRAGLDHVLARALADRFSAAPQEAVLSKYCAQYDDERPHRSCEPSTSRISRRANPTARRQDARGWKGIEYYSAMPIAV